MPEYVRNAQRRSVGLTIWLWIFPGKVWKLIDILDHRSKDVPRGMVEEGRYVVVLSVSGCQVMDSGVLDSTLLM
jgi:hypothetical protein